MIPPDLIEGYQGKATNPNPRLLDELYGSGLGITGFESFLEVAAHDPVMHKEMALALKLDEKTFYPPFCKTEHEKRERLRYLPLVYGPRIRSIFLDFINTSLRLNSQNISDNSPWDIVVVGAGFHGSLLVNRIKAENPGARVLIVDKEPLPSKHFHLGGHYFRMNNTLNDHDEGPTFQGHEKYNLPHTYGPVQVTDLTGHRWPAAKLIAEIGRITLFSSQCDCLLNTEITAVEKVEKLYQLKTSSGKTISASKIVFATGLGKPKIPCDDAESKEIVEKALLKPDKIMTVEQAFAITPKIEPLSIWNTDLILAGYGNSALTFLEFLYSIGPDDAYRFESIQKKTAIKTAIIAKNAEAKLRPRYSGIASPLKEGQAKLHAGALTKVRYRDDGSVVAFYITPDGETKSLVGKKLILGTGYELQVENLLKVKKEDFKPVKELAADSTILVPVAKKLDNEEIYIVGPAAGRDLVDVDHNTNGVPLVEIGQAEAIPYSSILTETFGGMLAKAVTVKEAAKKRFVPMRTIEASSTSGKAPLINLSEKPTLDAEFLTETVNEEIATTLKSEILQLFSYLQFKNMAAVQLKFSWENEQLMIEGLKGDDIEWLAEEIKKHRSLLCHLTGFVDPLDTLTISVKIGQSIELHLATRPCTMAYLKTSNPQKKLESQKLFSTHGVKLFVAPGSGSSATGPILDRIKAKVDSVPEGVFVEVNTLQVESDDLELQNDALLLQTSIGKKAEWHCYYSQKSKGEISVFHAVVPGEIVEKRGEGGFGFDSSFQPAGSKNTLAEEKPDQYNARALAIKAQQNNNVYTKI